MLGSGSEGFALLKEMRMCWTEDVLIPEDTIFYCQSACLFKKLT